MSLSELDSGMVSSHITAVQRLMKEENTFLFVRPTEYDSTVLIKEGFATKSMDIHDKSSNWGPMAGMVPCDPAFSKKLEGTPNENLAPASHGQAHPIQLNLSDTLYAKFRGTKIKEQTGYHMAPNGNTVESGIAPRHDPQVKFCTASDAGATGPKATLFHLKKTGTGWDVSWVKWANAATKAGGTLVPLKVWAYQVGGGEKKPVTGDYDLWMVAPFWKNFGKHSIVEIVEDEHGKSAATPYITELLQKMNVACERADNPVFNHGAEAQNYGFTQTLDKRIAMFTPSGDAYPVSLEVLPQILSEIQNAGYFVYWNKRYGEIDPKLSGKTWKQREESAARALQAFSGYVAELDALRKQGINVASGPDAVRARAAAGHTGVGKARFRHAVRQVIARGDRDIRKFHNDLQELMRKEAKPLAVLRESDFPEGYRQFKGELRRMMQDLQKGVVDSTDPSGTGQADLDRLSDMMSAWKREWEGYFG
jgi:hypothetical protein